MKTLHEVIADSGAIVKSNADWGFLITWNGSAVFNFWIPQGDLWLATDVATRYGFTTIFEAEKFAEEWLAEVIEQDDEEIEEDGEEDGEEWLAEQRITDAVAEISAIDYQKYEQYAEEERLEALRNAEVRLGDQEIHLL